MQAATVQQIAQPAPAHWVNSPFPPLDREIRSTITTEQAAFYLNRRPQTLRTWACLEKGPIRPIRICGRLAWKVSEIATILNGEVAK
jgi:hypothetical protein